MLLVLAEIDVSERSFAAAASIEASRWLRKRGRGRALLAADLPVRQVQFRSKLRQFARARPGFWPKNDPLDARHDRPLSSRCNADASGAGHHGPQALAVEREARRRVVNDHRRGEIRHGAVDRPRGISSASSRETSSAEPASALTTIRSHPRGRAGSGPATLPLSPAFSSAPLRLLSTRCRAPHFVSHSASTFGRSQPNACR